MKSGHGFVWVDEILWEKLNSRGFKRCVKQRQTGICAEPAAKVDSTFLRRNVYVIPSLPPSWMSAGHS